MSSKSRVRFKRGEGSKIKDLRFKRGEGSKIKDLKFKRGEKVSLKELEFRLNRIVPTPKISPAAVRWEQVKLAVKIRGREIGEALLKQEQNNQQQSEEVNFDDADVLDLLPDNSESSESTA